MSMIVNPPLALAISEEFKVPIVYTAGLTFGAAGQCCRS